MRLPLCWLLTLFLLFSCLLGVDIVSKIWVQHALTEPMVVFRTPLGIDFILQRAINHGGAFGMLSAFQPQLLALRILILAGLLFYLLRFCKMRSSALYLTLVFTGAFGNVLDNFLYGYVVDMFHFLFWGRSYGIFNFADALIFLGCLGMVCSRKSPAPATIK